VEKLIEIVGLDSIRRGIPIGKSCIIKDIIEKEKIIAVTDRNIVSAKEIRSTMTKLLLMKFLKDLFHITYE
jgi:hypothetical protein